MHTQVKTPVFYQLPALLTLTSVAIFAYAGKGGCRGLAAGDLIPQLNFSHQYSNSTSPKIVLQE